MKNKKIAAASVLLGVSLAVAACGGNNGNGTESSSPPASGSAPASAPPSENAKIEEITVAFPMLNTAQKDLKLVEDEINKISEAKIATHVNLKPIGAGEWTQQLTLMFTTNETVDLMPVFGAAYSGMAAKGQLIPLNGLLDQYGEGIKTAVGDYMAATRIKGESYAVPTIRDLAMNYGFSMVKSLVDKYQIDVASIKTLDDFEQALRKVKAGESFAPLVPAAPGHSFFDEYVFYDKLGDNLGVLPNYDNGLKVVNLYEMPEYKDFLVKIRGWYQDGLAMKDASTNKTSTYELIKSGKAFGTFTATKPGFVAQEKLTTGIELAIAETTPAIATTTSVQGVMWGIPVLSKQQERAMRFLNLMYSDKDIVNLFDWGVEGTHYVKVDGQDNVIKYPEGVDPSTLGYVNSLHYLFGNQFLSYVLEGNDPQIWEEMKAYNDGAIHSKALGFVFDASLVKTEYAAVSNVVTQYKLPLETGSVDPEKILPEFVAKLKSAGIDKIIAEKQKQLDEWAKGAQ